MSRNLSIGLIFFILFLIFFDAVQQKYYIETFGLLPEGTELTIGFLLKKHSIRWLAWGFVSIPFGLIMWRILTKKRLNLTSKSTLLVGGIILINTFFSLIIISVYDIIDQELTFSLTLLFEFLTFFTFQKGLTFLMASITLSLIIYNQFRERTIESQLIEITSLKRKSSDLEEALNVTVEQEPHLNIKTGNRLQPIPVNDVIWIQSDDYCVRIHTEVQVFTLRKSMKALEAQLSSYGFIRVHRMALLNLNFLHQINFEASTIQLSNTTELPLSKTGAKALKKRLEESAV